MKVGRTVFGVVAGLGLACGAMAQQMPAMNVADELGELIFEHTAPTAMVLVVVRDGEVYMQSYGQTEPGSRQKPGADSLIRLCSLSKIMATDLLVKLAVDGKVALTDPLQKFAPAGVTVPTRTVRGPALRGITLGDLATHTAGLPREIAYPPEDGAHFTFPDYKFRWEWLPGFRLRTSPGVSAHYSNISFDLLGDALAAAGGKPYEQLFAERTAGPLGLRDTTLTPTIEQCGRLLIGAKDEGACTDTQAAAGSGGMYSTAQDMARWLKYLLGLPGVPMAQNPAATAGYLKPEELHSMQGLSHAGTPSALGLGWVIVGEPGDPARIVEKTGGGAGFLTYIALNPARHTGVFVAETEGRRRASANLFRETNDLLIAMAGLPPLPIDPNTLREPAATADTGAGERAATARPAARNVTGKRRAVRRVTPSRAKGGGHAGKVLAKKAAAKKRR